jgi:sulfite reductase (NADPH) flavoprotein alpha-component
LIDRRFAELGATRLTDRIDADTQVDAPFMAFREQLWPALQAVAPGLAAAPTVDAGEASQDEDDQPQRWTRDHPFAAELLGKAVLNGPQSDKEVRHIVLSLKDSGLTYEPGDALGVWPRQSPELVEAILSATGMAADAPVTVDGAELTLGEALATRRELTILTPPTVIKLADASEDAQLCALTRHDQGAALQQFLRGRILAICCSLIRVWCAIRKRW